MLTSHDMVAAPSSYVSPVIIKCGETLRVLLGLGCMSLLGMRKEQQCFVLAFLLNVFVTLLAKCHTLYWWSMWG